MSKSLAPTSQKHYTASSKTSIFHLNGTTRLLLWGFIAYLMIPAFNIPFLPVSPSAIFITLVGLELFFRTNLRGLGDFMPWTVIAYALFIAFIFSFAANVLNGTLFADTGDLIRIVRTMFWLGCMFTMMVLAARLPFEEVRQLIIVMGVAGVILGFLRLFEAVVLGNIGPGFGLLFFTQNTYGILFSRVAPAVFALSLLLPNKYRLWSILALGSFLLAVVINGSRSSWIAISVGTAVFVMLTLFSGTRRFSRGVTFVIVALLIGIVGMANFLSFEAFESISARFATLSQIEEDESFLTRQLMVQKSQQLFEENWMFGIGVGQFREREADLVLPENLTLGSTDPNRIAAHNSYAALLAETGLMGVVPFVFLMILLAFRGFRTIFKVSGDVQIIILTVFCSFLTQGIHMWAIDNLATTASWAIYGMLAGLIVRAGKVLDEN